MNSNYAAYGQAYPPHLSASAEGVADMSVLGSWELIALYRFVRNIDKYLVDVRFVGGGRGLNGAGRCV